MSDVQRNIQTPTGMGSMRGWYDEAPVYLDIAFKALELDSTRRGEQAENTRIRDDKLILFTVCGRVIMAVDLAQQDQRTDFTLGSK
jgi:hypothetical protein